MNTKPSLLEIYLAIKKMSPEEQDTLIKAMFTLAQTSIESAIQRAEQNASAPRYTHDCECCTYLGHFGQYDLYHCLQAKRLPTVLARYGNDGPEYHSGIPHTPYMPELAEALRRAQDRGLPVVPQAVLSTEGQP